MAIKIKLKIAFIISAVLLGISIIGWYVWHQEHRQHIFEAYVFSLKSGRSIFIRTPDDERILIDGGANSEIIRHISSILPFYSRHIDSIIATDTDGKNVSGLIDVLERYSVGHAYVPAVTLNSLGISTLTDPAYETLLDSISKKSIIFTELGASDSISTKDSMPARKSAVDSKVYISALFPVMVNNFSYSKASAPELLLKISYGENSILILNDASTKVQKYIASGNSTSTFMIRNSDVLVVSHSATSANMSHELISEIQPKFLVYSKAISKSDGTSFSNTKSNNASKSSNKKISIDPLAGIIVGNRFNLKEKGTIKIVSDGKNLNIQKTD